MGKDKNLPTGKFDPASVREQKRLKAVGKEEGRLDRQDGRRTRMGKDGGQGRIRK